MKRLRVRFWNMGIPVLICLFATSGCTQPTLMDQYQTFRHDPTEENLRPLDHGGREGAALLIGWLELHAVWELTEFPDGSGKMIGTTTTYEFNEGSEAPSWVVIKIRGSNLWIQNPYVLDWAESITTVHSTRTPLK